MKIVANDLAAAMQAQEVIDFAKKHKNSMAYFKAVQHRADLSGLLIDRVEGHRGSQIRIGSGENAGGQSHITESAACGIGPEHLTIGARWRITGNQNPGESVRGVS